MRTIRLRHPNLYRMIVAVAALDLFVGLVLMFGDPQAYRSISDSYLIEAVGNVPSGVSLALVGSAILVLSVSLASFAFVQRLLLTSFGLWLANLVGTLTFWVNGDGMVTVSLLGFTCAMHYLIISEPPDNPTAEGL